MNHDRLRFAEACAPATRTGWQTPSPHTSSNSAARGDREAIVGIEVALHRSAVFVDGWIAAREGDSCLVTESEIVSLTRQVFRDAGYGTDFPPDPDALEVRLDLCLGPLGPDERAVRRVSDDQAVAVGYACRGARGVPPAGAGACERSRPRALAAANRPSVAVPGARRGRGGTAVHLASESCQKLTSSTSSPGALCSMPCRLWERTDRRSSWSVHKRSTFTPVRRTWRLPCTRRMPISSWSRERDVMHRRSAISCTRRASNAEPRRAAGCAAATPGRPT